ncbi:MAG TPA: hypothetical protein VF766_05670, partial [Pyrinomonadaceae bacterium]
HTLMGIRLPVRQVLPVLLILLGAYMLVDYLLTQRRRERYLPALDANTQIPAVVPANSGRFQTAELVSHVSTSRSIPPLPFEQRP